jgi:hypothetical protein
VIRIGLTDADRPKPREINKKDEKGTRLRGFRLSIRFIFPTFFLALDRTEIRFLKQPFRPGESLAGRNSKMTFESGVPGGDLPRGVLRSKNRPRQAAMRLRGLLAWWK